MKRPLLTFFAIRKLRKEAGLTQEGLAEKAKISVQYVRAIEKGYDAISDEVKKKISDALNISVWALFPEIERKVDLFDFLVARHGQELVIRDKEVAMFKEVLSRMTEDEFDPLIESPATGKSVHRAIRAWAKAHGIEVIK
jgi:transcriptional regulator with XRE-family HTH domain